MVVVVVVETAINVVNRDTLQKSVQIPRVQVVCVLYCNNIQAVILVIELSMK